MKNNYSLESIENIDKNTSSISNLSDARSVVLWAYAYDRSVNDISDVIELNNGYVVAHLDDIKDEGTKKLEDVGACAIMPLGAPIGSGRRAVRVLRWPPMAGSPGRVV